MCKKSISTTNVNEEFENSNNISFMNKLCLV